MPPKKHTTTAEATAPAEAKPAAAKAPAKPAAAQTAAAKAIAAASAIAEAAESDKKKRRQIADVLELAISPARCQSHMKHHLTPPEVAAQLLEHRQVLKELKEQEKAGEDVAEEIAAQKAVIAEFNKNVMHLGGDAYVAMATVCDLTVKELLRFVMEETVTGGRKIVEVQYLHTENATNLVSWPLIRNLPAIVGYDPAAEEALKKARADENRAHKEARAAHKAAVEAGLEEPAGKRARARDDYDEEDGVTTNFQTYIDHATKELKQEEAFSALRISNRVREYVSDLVVQLIERFTTLTQIVVLDVLAVRTLNAKHIKAVVRMLLTDEGRAQSDIDEFLEAVDGKLAAHKEHLETEKTRKFENMTDEKRAELEEKQAAAEVARMEAKFANAKATAKARAEEAKKLQAKLAEIKA
jgi:hypothetical protein